MNNIYVVCRKYLINDVEVIFNIKAFTNKEDAISFIDELYDEYSYFFIDEIELLDDKGAIEEMIDMLKYRRDVLTCKIEGGICWPDTVEEIEQKIKYYEGLKNE